MKKKVMMIGSDSKLLQELARGLGSEYLVLQSSRGVKALNLLPLFVPDAIVLVKTGSQPDLPILTNRIRATREGREVPIVLLAPEGIAFQGLTGTRLHPIPTLSLPILRAVLRGTLQTAAAAAG